MLITHDIHIHTHLSRCGKENAIVSDYIENAKKLGLQLIGFSDHLWDDAFPEYKDFYEPHNTEVPFYEGQNVDHVLMLRSEINDANRDGTIKILHGAEVEYDPYRHDLAITEANAERFDYLIFPNSHTHMVMPKDYYTDKRKHLSFMMDAFMDALNSPLHKYIVTMAHPFCAVCCPYGYEEMLGMISDDDLKRCFDLCAEKNISVEINLSKFKDYTISQIAASNNIRLFRIAKERGCKFTFGSDAHSVQDQNQFSSFYIVSTILEITEDNISSFVKSNIKNSRSATSVVQS